MYKSANQLIGIGKNLTHYLKQYQTVHQTQHLIQIGQVLHPQPKMTILLEEVVLNRIKGKYVLDEDFIEQIQPNQKTLLLFAPDNEDQVQVALLIYEHLKSSQINFSGFIINFDADFYSHGTRNMFNLKESAEKAYRSLKYLVSSFQELQPITTHGELLKVLHLIPEKHNNSSEMTPANKQKLENILAFNETLRAAQQNSSMYIFTCLFCHDISIHSDSPSQENCPKEHMHHWYCLGECGPEKHTCLNCNTTLRTLKKPNEKGCNAGSRHQWKLHP